LMIHVDYDDPFYFQWFHELIQGLVAKVTTTSVKFTRGYTFHTTLLWNLTRDHRSRVPRPGEAEMHSLQM